MELNSGILVDYKFNLLCNPTDSGTGKVHARWLNKWPRSRENGGKVLDQNRKQKARTNFGPGLFFTSCRIWRHPFLGQASLLVLSTMGRYAYEIEACLRF